MQITKYIHSCLLIENEGEKLLFDPGKFSFVEGRVTPDFFKDINVIVITHDHPDHLEVEAVKIIASQSQATVVGNRHVAARLRQKNVEVTVLDEGVVKLGAFRLQAIAAPHEPILSKELPHNTAFLVNGQILNPGDSFGASLLGFRGTEVLVLPVMAPWLTELGVADFARQMKPQQVIAVHDGYAKDFFLKQRAETYTTFFDGLNIKFHALPNPGDTISL